MNVTHACFVDTRAANFDATVGFVREVLGSSSTGFGWCFFTAPEGTVYALQQDDQNTGPAHAT